MKRKGWAYRIFGVDPSLSSGFRLTLLDAFSIILAAIMGAFMTWITYDNGVWAALIAYLVAVLLMVVGLYVSRRQPGGLLSYLINLLVAAFLCIMASLNMTQMIAELLRMYYYDDGSAEPAFVRDFAHTSTPLYTLIMTIGPIFAVMLANRWMDRYSKGSTSRS